MKFGIIGNLEKPGLFEAVGQLVATLEANKMDYVMEQRLAESFDQSGKRSAPIQSATIEECAAGSDMVIAFGGDGTMLAVARLVGSTGIPILGVNLGKLGFLAEMSPDEMPQALGDILKKKYLVEGRMVLQATTPGLPGKTFHAVNDVVVDKSRSSRVIDLQLYINNAFAVTYRADGLIVSTPTGSTAYALSCGGPIVTPTSNVIGITPVSPHTLSGRPLIVPENADIRIAVPTDSEEVLFSADGQIETITRPPFEIHIRRAEYKMNLVKRMDRSYFDVLRAKFWWGKDARST